MTPVKINVELNDLKLLMDLAQMCAEDLVAEIEAANPGDHPVTVRKRNRDLADARKLLESIPGMRAHYGVEKL